MTIGRAQYLVLVGHGDNSAGSATVNEAVPINSRTDADNKFGTDTDLARAYRDARANGANRNHIYGVMADNTETTESFATTASGTLSTTPIVDDRSRVSAQDVTAGTSMNVELVYDSPVDAPTEADTVHINPHTGEWAADESSDYDITYSYSDWTNAISGAGDVIGESEFGVICPLSHAEAVANDLSTTLDSLRAEYRMALGVMAAQPNTTTDDFKPAYDTASYTDEIDNDAVYLVAPVAEGDSHELAIGAVGGLFAGNDVSDPVYNDSLTGVDSLAQTLSKAEADDLRNERVIPLRDRGEPRVKGNISTSTETDWDRDFWRRRIVDLTVVTAKAIGDEIIGFINDSQTRATAETLIQSELRQLVDDRLLQPNSAREQNMFVDVYEIDPSTVGIDLGITPYGVVKNVEISLTIDT